MKCDCNWKAELAAIFNQHGGVFGIMAEKLSASAASEEDWREKCEILHAPGGFYVEWWNDRGGWWIDHKSGQFLLCAAKPGHDWALFPTRAAAEAALASASPPGQPAASSGDDNGNPRDDSWRPPKPAPQPATAEFDAAEWADRVRYRIDNSPSVNRVEIIASEGGLLWLSAYAAGLSAREQPQLADATDAAFKAGYVEGQKAAAPAYRTFADKSPAMGEWVLVHAGVGKWECREFDGQGGWAFWMPLPPAPKEVRP